MLSFRLFVKTPVIFPSSPTSFPELRQSPPVHSPCSDPIKGTVSEHANSAVHCAARCSWSFWL